MAPAVGRIRRQATFRALSRPDGRARSGPVSVVFGRVPGASNPTAGFAVGRRHGGAVRRNRLRRRLRAAVGAAGPELVPGAYLLRATPEASELGFDELCEAVLAAAKGAADRARAQARDTR